MLSPIGTSRRSTETSVTRLMELVSVGAREGGGGGIGMS